MPRIIPRRLLRHGVIDRVRLGVVDRIRIVDVGGIPVVVVVGLDDRAPKGPMVLETRGLHVRAPNPSIVLIVRQGWSSEGKGQHSDRDKTDDLFHSSCSSFSEG